MKKEIKSLQFIRKLNKQLCAKMNPYVITHEEEKFLRLFGKIADTWRKDAPDFKVFTWSITEGLQDITQCIIENGTGQATPVYAPRETNNNNTMQGLLGGSNNTPDIPIVSFNDFYAYAKLYMNNHIYIIKDAHNILNPSNGNYNLVVRSVKDLLIASNKYVCNFIFLAPKYDNIIDLQNDITITEMPLPDEKDIQILLDEALTTLQSENDNLKFDIPYKNNIKNKIVKSAHPQGDKIKEKIIFNLRGLTENEISRTISFVIVNNNGLNEDCIQEIQDAKKQIIESSGALEFISSEQIVNVGGHDIFKEYIEGRGLYLNPEMRELYSLKAPKGVLMVGSSGAGKSLLAKYVGQQWNIPLIRLDMGSIFGKYLGESENNLRQALMIAEANSPCILFIDELEKALGSSQGDGGTSLRILGKLLTWLQEKDTSMVYLFATANSLTKLPPELLRAGRFDAKFWADIPSESECKEIFEIKCKENNFNLTDSKYEQLAHDAFEKNMTGAEIEHVVIQAVYKVAVQAYKEKQNISIGMVHLRNAMMEITTNAEANKESLDVDRKRALKEYIFTSSHIKQYIENNISKSS